MKIVIGTQTYTFDELKTEIKEAIQEPVEYLEYDNQQKVYRKKIGNRNIWKYTLFSQTNSDYNFFNINNCTKDAYFYPNDTTENYRCYLFSQKDIFNYEPSIVIQIELTTIKIEAE